MDEQINGMVETIQQLEKENAYLKLRLGAVMQRVQNIAAYFAKKTPMPSSWSNDILDYILNRSEHEA